MYKYILKKDLPFAKAGKELSILENNIVYWTVEGNLGVPPGLKATANIIWGIDKLETLIADGWIEKQFDKGLQKELMDNARKDMRKLPHLIAVTK